jgi:hypothetical protein
MFESPLTTGFFYSKKMRAIHRVVRRRLFREVLEIGGGRSGLTLLLSPEGCVINLDADHAVIEAPCNRLVRRGWPAESSGMKARLTLPAILISSSVVSGCLNCRTPMV